MTATVDEAYRYCETVTRREARNFSYGIRLLAPRERRALSAVYAVARRIDDIGDSTAPAGQRLAQLDEVRAELRSCSPDSPDPAFAALAHAAAAMPIPLAAFEELIDGCRDDVLGVRYDTFEQLLHYCRCVAGSIGRLSLGVFGCSDPLRAAPLADALGVALQLTNILRDVREDRISGRVYLPAEDLERFGCRLELAGTGLADPAEDYARLIRFEAARAEQWYQAGLQLLPLLDRRSFACCAAMSGIYHRLLHRIEADPAATARGRLSLQGREKLGVALRSLAGLPA